MLKDPVATLCSNAGALVEDNAGKAALLSQQFASVFTVDDGTMPAVGVVSPEPKLSSVAVNESQVYWCLRNLDENTAPGPDGIPAILLRRCAFALKGPLVTIFSLSLRTGEVPQDWRDATVVPIYKRKGSAKLAENYRPVSLTSILVKILESIVRDSMAYFFCRHKMLSSVQHGFVSRRSTVTNLLEYLDFVTDAVDNDKPVDCVMLDVAKAFDTVSHLKLLHILAAYGLADDLVRWIGSFLACRRQRVRVGNVLSIWVNVTSGVPQGSVLGPLLFVLYVNELPVSLHNAVLKAYADDLKVVQVVNSVQAANDFQAVIDELALLFKSLRLSLSVGKCTVLHFGHANTGASYAIDDVSLKAVGQARDFGVIVDVTLKVSDQCAAAVHRAYAIGHMIFRSFELARVDRAFALEIYCIFVRPQLEYATQVWSPYQHKDIATVEQVQHWYTRKMPGSAGLEYEERLRRFGLESLELRRLRADMLFVYKVCRERVDITGHTAFLPRRTDMPSHRPGLRGSDDPDRLLLRKCNLECRKHFFTFRVVKVWNAIRKNVKQAVSVKVFRACLLKDGPDVFLNSTDRWSTFLSM